MVFREASRTSNRFFGDAVLLGRGSVGVKSASGQRGIDVLDTAYTLQNQVLGSNSSGFIKTAHVDSTSEWDSEGFCTEDG